MKDTDRQRIERALEEFDAWRASGMALKAYVQLRGEELSHWRARLSWERRWRQMLNGTYTKDTAGRCAFVQATPNQTRTTAKPHPLSLPQPALHPAQQTTLRIVINAKVPAWHRLRPSAPQTDAQGQVWRLGVDTCSAR